MSSRILEEMHGTAQYLFAGGFIDKHRMDEHEALFRTSAATVRPWETGGKKPGGPSCKLLDLLDRKGIEALL